MFFRHPLCCVKTLNLGVLISVELAYTLLKHILMSNIQNAYWRKHKQQCRNNKATICKGDKIPNISAIKLQM